MKTNAQLNHEKIRFDEPKDTHLVVTLTAPPAATANARQPVCVIPVLDVSGSMEGRKLHYAKQSILKLIDHLAPGDFCGVVLFSTEVETLAAPAAMTPAEKESLRAAVGRVEARSNTNLAGGLLAGLDHARVTRLPAGMPVRVILFTDGLANAGPAKHPAELRALLEANRGEATVSAFGYGDDADQDLLRELSDLGKGNYAYVQSPEDALTAFARELGGLLSTCAQRIVVHVKPQPGLTLTDVVSDVEAAGTDEGVAIQVPELLSDEVRHLVLAVTLAPRPVALDAPATVADVEVAYESVEAGHLVAATEACKVLARFVVAGEAQLAPDPELDRVVAIAQLVRVQIEAEEAAREGRFEQARNVTVLFQEAIVRRGHGDVAAAAGHLAGAVGDGSSFERSKGYRSSLRKGSTRSVASTFEAGAEADLRAMGRGTATEAQRRMEQAFGGSASCTPQASSRPSRVLRKRSRRW